MSFALSFRPPSPAPALQRPLATPPDACCCCFMCLLHRTVSNSKTVFGTWADRIRANVSAESCHGAVLSEATGCWLTGIEHVSHPIDLGMPHLHCVLAVQNTASVTNAFQHWQLYWGWQYDTPQALAAAFKNWQQSVLKVHAALSQLSNATGPDAYLIGLTKMSDLSPTDFLKHNMGLRHGVAKPRSRLVVIVAFTHTFCLFVPRVCFRPVGPRYLTLAATVNGCCAGMAPR